MVSQNILSLKVYKILPFFIFQNIKDEHSLICSSFNLLISLKLLKDQINLQYTLLSCISGIDLLQSSYRFLIVYDLLSLKYNNRLKIKIFLKENQIIESIQNLYINANWWEREIWDLFGVYFNGNKDLRRILTDYTFEGFPLRKDFPLSGYMEIKYEFFNKSIVYKKIQLMQEFRKFDGESFNKKIIN